MAAVSGRNSPLLLPEIVEIVVNNVRIVPDLLNCACVNSTWSVAALRKLYEGSLNDMRFRTPDIGSLNCLLVASRERFSRNMSFVKHLLLSPEKPGAHNALYGEGYLACFEKCRAIGHREYAELLLRPRGKGLESLTIPFNLIHQDWSLAHDLLFPPTVKFLAIDICYCEILMKDSGHPQELTVPGDKFSNLKALTIYTPTASSHIDNLCGLLRCCDLQFFHLEEVSPVFNGSTPGTEKLLDCLRRQTSLKALALFKRYHNLLWERMYAMEAGEDWPRLKALYLRQGNRYWLEQLPNLEELQILHFEELEHGVRNISQKAIKAVAKCRHLRSIDLTFKKLPNVESLLDIVHGCPFLKRLRAWNLRFRNQKRIENMFWSLLRGLVQLEVLELDLSFRIDGAKLQDVARHLPRLTLLSLPEARLNLSLEQMRTTHPFRQLRGLELKEIWCVDLLRAAQRDKIESIAAAWRRVFPNLRMVPCRAKLYGRLSGDLEERDNMGKLLLCLGCQSGWDIDHQLSYMSRVGFMWRSNLEIETIGWPVIPLEVFSDTDQFPSTN